jgi:hypothetical protein
VTDRLVFVLAREPLANVPAGRELTSRLWQPSAAVWTPIAGGLVATTQEVRQVMPGTRQSRGEAASIRRSVHLRPDDPGPAIVRAVSAPDARQLVTHVDLVH